MNDTYRMLSLLLQKAKANPDLRERILKTAKAADPLDEFCAIASSEGFPVTIGDIITIGGEYSDNQCKSTNGGAPAPYDYFDDPYEMFLTSLE